MTSSLLQKFLLPPVHFSNFCFYHRKIAPTSDNHIKICSEYVYQYSCSFDTFRFFLVFKKNSGLILFCFSEYQVQIRGKKYIKQSINDK